SGTSRRSDRGPDRGGMPPTRGRERLRPHRPLRPRVCRYESTSRWICPRTRAASSIRATAACRQFSHSDEDRYRHAEPAVCLSRLEGWPMASGQEVLVVDLGSSWCKAALIDATGRVNGTGEEWVREERIFGHDAAALERIWRAVRLSIARALESRSGDPLAAIAIATRKAPGIWLDGAGEPIGLEPEVAARVGREEIDACYASHFWR